MRPDIVRGRLRRALRARVDGRPVFRPAQVHGPIDAADPVAVDTMVYKRSEIERVAHLAFEAARLRRGKKRDQRGQRPTCWKTACCGAKR